MTVRTLSRRFARFCCAFLVLGVVPGSVTAQSPDLSDLPCDPDQSLKNCYETTYRSEVTKAKKMTREAAEERVTPAKSPGTGNSVVDLIPLFTSSLGLQGVNDTDGNLTFDKIFDLGSVDLSLGATAFQASDLFGPLATHLGDQDDVVTALEKEIGDFDKVDARVLFGYEGAFRNHRFGRDPGAYDNWIQALMSQAYSRRHGDSGTKLEDWRLSDEAMAAANDLGADFFQKSPNELVDPSGDNEAAVRSLVTSLVAAAGGTAQARSQTETRMTDVAQTLSQMITNQPQLLLEGKYQERRHLTGPTAWSGRFCFEWGLSGNVNDFERFAAKEKNGCASADYACLLAWQKQNAGLSMAGTEADTLDRGHRLAIAVEYTDTDPFDFTPDSHDTTAQPFSLDGSETWTGSLTYGVNFDGFQLPNLLGSLGGKNAVPVDSARFDLEAKYDDVSGGTMMDGEEMLQSRFVATASLSQKMSDNSIVSLSLVWANKPEYLGDVDENLSASLGLRWSLDSQKDGSDSNDAP